MNYQFSHYILNGALIPERETSILMTDNVELVAHYLEEGPMSVKIRNTETQNQIIEKVTLISETYTIAPGDVAEIPYNPDTDELILKPNP